VSYYEWTGAGWKRSYAPGVALARGLGDVEELRDTFPVFYPSSVYVFRFRATGAQILTARDALAFVRAVGQQTNLGIDIHGVAVQPVTDDPGAVGAQSVDIVWTVPQWSMRTPIYGDSPSSLALKVQNDASLRATFPSLAIDSAIFGELTAPAQAVDFWKNQPVLWVSSHEGEFGSGAGGPTNSFANPPAASVVRGKADDGAMATPWPIDTPPIVTPGPSGSLLSGSVSSTSLLVGGLLAAGLGYYLVSRHKRTRSYA
jgi:hypothetical protein